ncbi:Hypothetical predicted protein [Octopus vulgaris]|uniref:Uncharacterized protein n=1 Tax=Octopus vulgaris TaxID=6645 RepID=A0AA36F5E1_OCTVU|nr:Hypothetical predicted protein [Octopus vulgaris]
MLKSIKERGRHSMFQHDNDPKHTSEIATKFLSDKRVKEISFGCEGSGGIFKILFTGWITEDINSLQEYEMKDHCQMSLTN